MKKNIIINNIICCFFALSFILMFFNLEIYNRLSAFSIYIIFAGLIILFANNIKEIFKNSRIKLITILLLIINLFVASIITNSGLGALWIIVNIYILIIISPYIKLSQMCIKYICLILGIFGIYFSVKCTNIFNSNTFGYISLASALFLFNYLKMLKMKYYKGIIISIITIIQIITLIYFFNIILISECRSALFAYIFFILYSVIINITGRSKLINSIIPFFIILGQLLFVFFYLYLWLNDITFELSFSSKALYTGREEIWYELLNVFKDNILWGIGSNYDIQSFKILNVHNSLFDILVVYGLINFIGFLILFIKFVLGMKYNRYAFVAILSFIFVGYFETNLLWNSTLIVFVLMSVFAYNAQNKEEERDGKNKYIYSNI